MEMIARWIQIMRRQERYQELLQKYLPEYIQAANETYDAYMQKNQNDSVLITTTSYVIAPILHAYVRWVLADAAARNIRRLYFLSRDGYQMLEAAKLICIEHSYDIELRYLHCSRYAFEIPSNHLRDDYMNRICTGGKAVYIDDLLRRGGLNEQEVESVIRRDSRLYQLSQKREVLSYRQIRNLRQVLMQNSYFCRLVMEHSQEAYPACIGYLRQEGLFDLISCAVVDSGWTGGLQELLECLLQSAGHPRKLDGYYFGLYDLPARSRKDRYHSFYFYIWGDYRYKTFFNNNVYEVIYSAPEAMTIGYRKEPCAGRGINYASEEGQWIYVPVYLDKQIQKTCGKNASIRMMKEELSAAEYDHDEDERQYEFYHRQLEIIRSFIIKRNAQDRNRRSNIQNDHITTYDRKLYSVPGSHVPEQYRNLLRQGLLPILREFMCDPSRGEVKLFGAIQFSDHLLESGSSMLAEPLSINQLRANHLIPRIRSMLNGSSLTTGYWLLGSLRRVPMTKQEHKRQRRQILAYQYAVYIKKDLIRMGRFLLHGNNRA